MAARRLDRKDYTIGWVCALPVELAAAQEMLDEEHQDLPQNENDTSIYTLGRIGAHNVVIACLPEGQTGMNSAAAVATQMNSTFSSIRFGLMVGIGGGVPGVETDIRLGDVVVSRPHNVHGGVVQYDFGKITQNGFERTGSLNTPPAILLSALGKLQANHMRGRTRLSEYASKLNRLPKFTRNNAGLDILFEADYNHVGGATCERFSKERVVDRQPRSQEIMVYYGTIASGSRVMRDATERDRVSLELGGVLCFEMEAAGLMNNFPCLIIRGICDYADSHKDKRWQAYAAGTAAACAKELLSVIPVVQVANSRTVDEIIREDNEPMRLSRTDVDAELEMLARKKGAKLHWKESIIDLLKLLDLKSEPDDRALLAKELKVDVGQQGTKEQNTALYGAMIEELTKTRGKVPDRILNFLKL